MKRPAPPASGAVKGNKKSRTTRALKKAMAAEPAEKYFFRLFVAGATTRSRQTLRHVYHLCEARLKDNYELEVIDVYQQPELARDHQIVATPTLVKERPAPIRRFIGNLADVGSLFAGLGVTPENGAVR